MVEGFVKSYVEENKPRNPLTDSLMSSDSDWTDVKGVERVLLRLDDDFTLSDSECNVQLGIHPLGQWNVKFRKQGVIFNNCDLVIAITDVHAHINFKSISAFWSIVNGGENIEEALSKGNVSQGGSESALEMFWRRFVFRPGDNPNGTAGALLPSRPLRSLPNGDNKPPLKSGWLLKKRDLFSGWRCRFFVVYYGRLEYYIDQHDVQPRGVVSLNGAEVHGARKITIPGVGERWGFVVKPKHGEKPFNLASEMTGDDGHAVATNWAQVFTISAKATADMNPLASSSYFSLPSSGHQRDSFRLEQFLQADLQVQAPPSPNLKKKKKEAEAVTPSSEAATEGSGALAMKWTNMVEIVGPKFLSQQGILWSTAMLFVSGWVAKGMGGVIWGLLFLLLAGALIVVGSRNNIFSPKRVSSSEGTATAAPAVQSSATTAASPSPSVGANATDNDVKVASGTASASAAVGMISMDDTRRRSVSRPKAQHPSHLQHHPVDDGESMVHIPTDVDITVI